MSSTITLDNLSETLEQREVKDKLMKIDHPNKHRAENGYTYLDYVLWKINQNAFSRKYVVRELNKKLSEKS